MFIHLHSVPMSKGKCSPPNPSTDSVIHTYPPACKLQIETSVTHPCHSSPRFLFFMETEELWLLAYLSFPLTGRFGMLLCEAWTHVNSLILFQIFDSSFLSNLDKENQNCPPGAKRPDYGDSHRQGGARGHPALSCSGAHCLRASCQVPRPWTINTMNWELL